MNKFFWFLNLILLLLAILVTAAIFRGTPATPVAQEDGRGGKRALANGQTRQPRPSKPSRQASYIPQTEKPVAGQEILWTRSLFRPDRAEPDSADSTGGDTTALSELELIGIAMVGDGKAAIIAGPDTPAAVPPVTAATAATATKAPPPKKRIYRLNQPVAETGYLLTAINAEDVELTKGNDIQVLMMNRGSASSQKRQAAAAGESLQRQRAAASAAARTATTAPAILPAAAANTAVTDEQRKAIDDARRKRDEFVQRMQTNRTDTTRTDTGRTDSGHGRSSHNRSSTQ